MFWLYLPPLLLQNSSKSTPITYPIAHPSELHVFFFFEKKNNSSNWCCLCTLGYGLIHRNVFDLPGVTQLEKIESPSVCSHQPSMTPQLWLGAHEPLTTPCWNGVAWSCAGNQRCCEFISGVAMACSEDTISPWLCDLSVFYSTMSLCFFRNHRRDLILPYCCSS